MLDHLIYAYMLLLLGTAGNGVTNNNYKVKFFQKISSLRKRVAKPKIMVTHLKLSLEIHQRVHTK